MKSEPGCSMTCDGDGASRPPASRSNAAADGTGAVAFPPRFCAVRWAFAGVCATSAAAPAAAPFRKPRRPTDFFLDFAIVSILPERELTDQTEIGLQSKSQALSLSSLTAKVILQIGRRFFKLRKRVHRRHLNGGRSMALIC